jgi:O-antigen/teichoic acid export membrane protein
MTIGAEQTQQASSQLSATDMNAEMVRRKASGAVVSLAYRRVINQVMSFTGNVCLARLLSPAIFGMFATVQYVVNFFGFFGDIGFGATLVQRKEPPTEKVLRTVFAIQQGLITILVMLVFVAAPYFARKYHMSESSVWLFRALSLSLFLTSMKVIPSIHLERKLEFRKIVIPEMAETFVFFSVAVTMAFMHYGIWSLVCATVARGFVGFIIFFILAPWRIGFAFDVKTARDLMSFGGPFQLGQFFWLIRNAAIPLFAGAMCGMKAVGYLNWSWGLSLQPYCIIEIVNRVVFPVCSRLQDDKEALGTNIGKYVRMAALGVFPIACVMMAVVPWAIRYVYNGHQPHKWDPALPSLYLFMASMMASPIIKVYSRAFYAMRQVRTAVTLTAVYVFTGWALNVPLVLKYGYNGIAISTFLVSVLCIWLPIREMRKIVEVPVLKCIWVPLVGSLVSLAVTRWLAIMFIKGIPSLVLVTAFGFVVYFAAIWLLQGQVILAEIKSFMAAARSSSSAPANALGEDTASEAL